LPMLIQERFDGDLMQVQIEFFGLSRVITGKKNETVDFTEGATFRELVRQLGCTYPGLIGDVIQAGQDALQPPNVFHLKDRHFIKQDQLDQYLKPNDHIVLMSLSAGG
jgi:molybdopterin converting factor small subunit